MRKHTIIEQLPIAIAIMVCIPFLVGCSRTRTISDSGYNHSDWRYSTNHQRTELSEFDVLGIHPDNSISEDDIAEAFNRERTMSIPKGSSIMVIQSGAQFPDQSMHEELSKHFQVISFSGIHDKTVSGVSYSKTLRLAAAQGGLEYILCYWGVLETADTKLATKTVSWVPVIGRMIPDEHQMMRIQLKMVIIDARTGQWAIITPEAQEDRAISMGLNRESSDQNQVAKLKNVGYAALVAELSEKFITTQ